MSRNWFARKFGSPRWRFGLTSLCLLVFTAQSTIAQAHVHPAPRNAAGSSFSRSVDAVADRGVGQAAAAAGASASAQGDSAAAVGANAGLDIDQASASGASADLSKGTPPRRAHDTDSGFCPLCHFLLVGAALLPHFSAPSPAAAATSIVSVDQASPHSIAAVSYSWQGRGPPRAA